MSINQSIIKSTSFEWFCNLLCSFWKIKKLLKEKKRIGSHNYKRKDNDIIFWVTDAAMRNVANFILHRFLLSLIMLTSFHVSQESCMIFLFSDVKWNSGSSMCVHTYWKVRIFLKGLTKRNMNESSWIEKCVFF
jgi:hypothetical protein